MLVGHCKQPVGCACTGHARPCKAKQRATPAAANAPLPVRAHMQHAWAARVGRHADGQHEWGGMRHEWGGMRMGSTSGAACTASRVSHVHECGHCMRRAQGAHGRGQAPHANGINVEHFHGCGTAGKCVCAIRSPSNAAAVPVFALKLASPGCPAASRIFQPPTTNIHAVEPPPVALLHIAAMVPLPAMRISL
eukprot:364576-Chlamydomonas_euryale.AAC.2